MLSLSTKHAIRALRSLAEFPPGDFVRVQQVSKKSGVPGPYLSKIMKTLAQKGLIESRRGSRGGVRLPTPRKPLSFYEICEALDDGSLSPQCILSKKGCNSLSPCGMHTKWTTLRERINQFLKDSPVL